VVALTVGVLLGLRVADAKTVERLNVSIPMRDGKHLAADVFLPSDEGKFPAIFIHTPYNRQYGGAPLPDALLAHDLLDREHYAYVLVDWRGFFGSKAAGEGKKRPNHGQDGYDVVEWIAAQEWNNGRVGMWGVSAVGAVQYEVAAEKPPHLVCIVPASANLGNPYGQFYHGGVLQRRYVDIMGAAGHVGARLVTAHPTPDDFWRLAAERIDARRIDLPVLFVTGWYDTNTDLKIGTFQRLRRSAQRYGSTMKLVIGPWLHTSIGKRAQGALEYPAAEGYADRQSMRFFDYWLRDERKNGWDAEPAVRYFQMGEDRWESAPDWPPATTGPSYYLRAGGRLTLEPPAGDEAPDSFIHDPGDPVPTVGGSLIEVRKAELQLPAGPQDLRPKIEARRDVVVYSSDTLTAPVTVRGTVRARLFISSDRRDTDFAVRLADVYPDGRSMLVIDGIQRTRFRESLERPEPMVPGRTHEVTVTLGPTAITFLPGHRIRVIVSSSNSPRFEVNTNIWRAEGLLGRLLGRSIKATNRVHHDEAHASALIATSLEGA
jgi:predicted acyl esterase